MKESDIVFVPSPVLSSSVTVTSSSYVLASELSVGSMLISKLPLLKVNRGEGRAEPFESFTV